MLLNWVSWSDIFFLLFIINYHNFLLKNHRYLGLEMFFFLRLGCRDVINLFLYIFLVSLFKKKTKTKQKAKGESVLSERSQQF